MTDKIHKFVTYFGDFRAEIIVDLENVTITSPERLTSELIKEYRKEYISWVNEITDFVLDNATREQVLKLALIGFDSFK